MPGVFAGTNRRFRWFALKLFALILSVPAPLAAQATDAAASAGQESAVNSAQNFVGRYDEGDFGEIYDTELGPSFKALMARDVFVQQGGFMRVQSGGKALAREFIGAQPFSQTPTGARGDYYYVRFRTRHPNGLVFQDVYLEKVGSQWKVAGFYMMPAPQQ
jgi:hypothetical protein